MSDLVLNVEVREQTGTGPARKVRRDGQVPGVLYGGDRGAVAIALKLNELKRGLNSGGFLSKVVEIDHKGERQPVLVRDIQFHPVSSAPVHIDLYRVDNDQTVAVEIPVVFVNEEASPGLKRGGALNIVRHTVELECRADSIPENIEINLDGLEINDSVHISAVNLPDGVEPKIKDRDFTIATIVGKGGRDDADDGADAPTDEAENGGEAATE